MRPWRWCYMYCGGCVAWPCCAAVLGRHASGARATWIASLQRRVWLLARVLGRRRQTLSERVWRRGPQIENECRPSYILANMIDLFSDIALPSLTLRTITAHTCDVDSHLVTLCSDLFGALCRVSGASAHRAGGESGDVGGSCDPPTGSERDDKIACRQKTQRRAR